MYANHHSTTTTSPPASWPDFISLVPIGYVSVSDYEDGKVLRVCESVEVPKKQFEGARRLVGMGELRRCQEWTVEVVEGLRRGGVLV